MKLPNINGTMVTIENFDKATHMRSLKMMGQVHIHINGGDSILLGNGPYQER